MTPAEFRAARERLGLTAEELAAVLHVQGSRTIYKWERGERRIPGSVGVLLTLIARSPKIRRMLGMLGI